MKKILIAILLVFVIGGGLMLSNEAIKAQRICRGIDFLTVENRLSFEESPGEYFKRLGQESWWLEFRHVKKYTTVIPDPKTKRVIIINLIEIKQDTIGGCLEAFHKALEKTEEAITQNADAVYYKQIRGVNIEGTDFLEMIIILRPTGNRT